MKIASSILYAPCPCGSGKKFKFCHLEAVRASLPDNPPPSIVTMQVRKAMQPFGMVNDMDPIEDRAAIDVMREGFRERDADRLDAAIERFRHAREMRPRLYTAWNNEAMCLWLLGRHDEAVRAQEDGLALSGDVNAYGWAQLSQFRHARHEDAERDRCALRALGIKPLSGDAAAKTCEALSRTGRHRDILDYALSSGFLDTPEVSFFAGVAAANCGLRARAAELLEAAGGAIPEAGLAREILRDLRDGTRNAVDGKGNWFYSVVETLTLSEETPPGWVLDDAADRALFEKSVRENQEVSPGSKRFAAVRDAFRDIHRRHPDFFRAEFNYAAMLEREGKRAEAVKIIEGVALKHPEYPFAQAALVDDAIREGDLKRAGFLVEDYRKPLAMHPVAYRAWLNSVRRYWTVAGNEERARNIAENIERIEAAFGL